MNRRNFIRNAGVFSLPLLGAGRGIHALQSSRLDELFLGANRDRVLVLIQLVGGNDGLNTLIPLDQLENLRAVRPRVVLPEASLLPIGQNRAFHPRMEGFRNLHQAGRLSIVQSVGYPNQNRSHFRSTDIWSTASPADVAYTRGWAGRYLESLQNPNEAPYPTGFPNDEFPHPLAITVGNSASQTCQGQVTNVGQTVKDPTEITYLAPGGNTPLPDNRLGAEIGFLRTAISQTNQYGAVINEAATSGTSTATYPEGRFGDELRHVARMIDGGLQTQIYVVQLGSFDTHASQVDGNDTRQGRHADLLGELSEGIAAFQQDLDTQGHTDRVLGMTFSEFGRQIGGNNSNGTDHGDAAPLFVFGGCASGTVLGENPTINAEVERGEAVALQYDFRDVYGSILIDWFELGENKVRELIYDDFQYLPVAGGCSSNASSLPVAFLSVACQGRSSDVVVNWQTAEEQDNKGFEVERSADGRSFQYLGWQAANRTAGTSGGADYSYIDADVEVGKLYYYRLRQVDHDGAEQLSTVVTARLDGTAIAQLTVGLPYPNPVVDHTTIKVYAPTDGRVTYGVYDMGGRRLLQDSQSLMGRRDNLVEVRTGRLPAGTYLLQFDFGDRRISRKFTVR